MAETYQLKWHSHLRHIEDSIMHLQKTKSFADVSLCTVDGKHSSAHRFILSACSVYFDQLLQKCAIGSSPSPLYIVLPPEITHKSLLVLLQYMYAGEATIKNSQLNGVLKAGEILKIRGLYQDKKGVLTQQNLQNPVDENAQSSMQATMRKKRPRRMNGKKTNGSNNHKEEELVPAVQESNSDMGNNGKEEENGEVEIKVKEEPEDWEFNSEAEIPIITPPEVTYASSELDDTENHFYAPLMCDICHQTFATPSLWVQHTQTHGNAETPTKRKRNREKCNGEERALCCELCQEIFATTSQWVRHIQSTHTDEQLALTTHLASSSVIETEERELFYTGASRKASNGRQQCPICGKNFPSHASMLIHTRTHTGEKPYLCNVCHKGFNVKSNLLRHMRTLHEILKG